MPNRGYTPRTSRLLREYLVATYPHAQRIAEYHLTQGNPSAIAAAAGKVSPRFGGQTLGYPDAAVITPDEVQLWEAKDYLTGAAVGQIEAYGLLWPISVEAGEYPDHRLTLHILAARDNPPARQMAQARGIEVVIYAPQWYMDSQARVAAAAEQRSVDTQALAIAWQVALGGLPEAAALTQLRGLGYSQQEGESTIERARQQASQGERPTP